MKRFLICATAMLSVIFSADALSDGSIEAGAGKAVVCGACHGANGNSVNPDWPSLAGLGAAYITTQLQNFKDGKRVNAIMTANAIGLSSQDMEDLGAYFNSQHNTGLEADPTYWKAGEKIYRGGDTTRNIPACMACHGPNGAGNEPAKFPALRGQHSEYVIKQLHDYASGARGTGPNGIMQTIAGRLTDDEMRDLASYVQGLR